MKNELLRRLDILEKKRIPQANARSLRGGMQQRLHRQEASRFVHDIKKSKRKIREKLKVIESQDLLQNEFGFGIQSVEELEDFREPMMKKIRSRRGFF